MGKKTCSILFLSKKNDERCQRALQFCEKNLTSVTAHLGGWGDNLPKETGEWEGEYIISYLSRWVVPKSLLDKAKTASVNFHPAPPEYPGFGCYNFAIYEEAKEYGVTCHHMAPKVDTGGIIAVKRFPIFPEDDVASLLSRTHDYLLILFYEIVSLIIDGRALPVSKESWARKPFTKRQVDELSRLTSDMSREEMRKRIRATHFANWKPTIEVQGFTFELKAGQENEHNDFGIRRQSNTFGG